MSELTGFLLARIAEDEDEARCLVVKDDQQNRPPLWSDGYTHFRHGRMAMTEGQHMEYLRANFETYVEVRDARLLAECEAKRRIVETCRWADEDKGWVGDYETYSAGSQASDVLELLALPYADHPDYREEWKP